MSPKRAELASMPKLALDTHIFSVAPLAATWHVTGREYATSSFMSEKDRSARSTEFFIFPNERRTMATQITVPLLLAPPPAFVLALTLPAYGLEREQ